MYGFYKHNTVTVWFNVDPGRWELHVLHIFKIWHTSGHVRTFHILHYEMQMFIKEITRMVSAFLYDLVSDTLK